MSEIEEMHDMPPVGANPFEAALVSCGLGAGLTANQLAELARDLKPSRVTLLEGQVLCRTGDRADRFWLVTSGSLGVSDQIEGENRGVQWRSAPALIGELALGRTTSQRTATMTAQEHVGTYEVKYACLENIASAEIRALLWRNLFTIACEKLAQSVPQRAAQSAAFATQETTLRRFVNPYALGQSKLEVREDYEEVEAIVWFSDLVGFSAFARGAETRDVAALIKTATSFISDAIEAEGGHIDKFMGDGVMAWWIIPGRDVVHRQEAANAAFRAARTVATGLSAALGAHHSLGIRIGLDRCQAHAGDFGSQARSAFTLIGDGVNAAARLEQAKACVDGTLLGTIRAGQALAAMLSETHRALLPRQVTIRVKDADYVLHTEALVAS